MGWVESLQRAIDYMEEHMEDTLTIDQIAEQANSSVFHFQRTFAILTDCSVAEYLRRRRLTLAAQELSATDRKIIDIAYKYGYDTPESFSKAFRRQHGVTPSEARKNVGKLQAFNRLVIQVNLKGADPMKYRIIEKASFQAIGIKREFSLAGGENMTGIPKMWQELNQNGTSSTIASLNDGEIKGLLGICADYQDGRTMDYWILPKVQKVCLKAFLSWKYRHQHGVSLKCTVRCRMPCQKCGSRFFRNGFHPISMRMLEPPNWRFTRKVILTKKSTCPKYGFH